jgi:hypothetical protein
MFIRISEDSVLPFPGYEMQILRGIRLTKYSKAGNWFGLHQHEHSWFRSQYRPLTLGGMVRDRQTRGSIGSQSIWRFLGPAFRCLYRKSWVNPLWSSKGSKKELKRGNVSRRFDLRQFFQSSERIRLYEGIWKYQQLKNNSVATAFSRVRTSLYTQNS